MRDNTNKHRTAGELWRESSSGTAILGVKLPNVRYLVTRALLAVILACSALISTAGPSAAESWSLDCHRGDLCTWWGQNFYESEIGFEGNVLDYWDVYYYSFPNTQFCPLPPDACKGAGERVANNNGSNANYGWGDWYARLHYDPYYSGPVVYLSRYGDPGWAKNGDGLGVLLNNLRSSSWVEYHDGCVAANGGRAVAPAEPC